MEAFNDTPIVNGTVYPTSMVEPKAYRFRILSIADDRFFNLHFYVAADKNSPTTAGTTGTVLCDGSTAIPATDCTEVKMVPAVATPGFPATWSNDGRAGGVPGSGDRRPAVDPDRHRGRLLAGAGGGAAASPSTGTYEHRPPSTSAMSPTTRCYWGRRSGRT